jgi:hypothetical protein
MLQCEAVGNHALRPKKTTQEVPANLPTLPLVERHTCKRLMSPASDLILNIRRHMIRYRLPIFRQQIIPALVAGRTPAMHILMKTVMNEWLQTVCPHRAVLLQ